MSSSMSTTAAERGSRANAIRVLGAGALLSFFSGPAVLIYPFGLFAIAIAESAGLQKQDIAATIGPVLLLTIPFAPVMGWVIQRFYAPTLVVAAMVGVSAGLLILSVAPTTPILFAVFLAAAFLLSQLASPGVSSSLVLLAFDKSRGLALGIVSAFTGVGVAVIPMAYSWMISEWGWRQAYAVGAGVIFVGAIANLLLMRRLPRARPAAERPKGQALGSVLKESLALLSRDPTFWIIAGYFFFIALVANTMPLHLPLILEERGAAKHIQTLSLTVTGISMVVARPLLGWVLDTFPMRSVMMLLVAGPLAGVLCLLLVDGELAALISAAGFGMTLGGEIVALTYIISRAFPLERFGSTFGWNMLILAFAVGAGPLATSALVKLSGSYHSALIMMLIFSVLALIIAFFLNDSRVRRSQTGLAKQGA